MNVDLSSVFSQMIDFLIDVFVSVLSWLDGIIIIAPSTSILDLNIALTIFSIIFVAVFAVVRSSAVNSVSSVDSARRSRKNREGSDK